MLRSDMGSALIGTQLQGVISPTARIALPRPAPIIISPLATESVGLEMRCIASANAVSSNYPAANTAIFVPFGISAPIVALKLWLQNGTAVAGQVDLGIFLPDGTMVVGMGATNQAGTTTIQEFDITDTRLDAGRYYLGMTSDTSGVTQKVIATAIAATGVGSAIGCLQAAQAPPLASVTFATFAQLAIPIFGLSGRALVV